MTISTCVETMSSPQDPWNPPPITFLFKDEGGLATHPLSVILRGCLAGEKIREK